jgi:hypothetical protein
VSFSCLRVTLTVAKGPVFHPLRQVFSLYLSGMVYKEGLKFSGSVAELEQPFRNFAASEEEFQELCRAAGAAGLTERLPKVDAVVDTSDSSAWVLLHVETEKGARTLSLGLLCSGYEGPDAAALHRFFGVLLSLAKVRDESVRIDLAGR